MRSLEISINRARGTAAVLGELKADVNIVLSAILSDVLAELTSDKQREQLSARFGEDVILLSENYNKLPVFMSKKAEYTDLQSENQIQVHYASPYLEVLSKSRNRHLKMKFDPSFLDACVELRGLQDTLHSM